MILAHNLPYTQYAKQRVIGGKVWFLVGKTGSKREAKLVSAKLRSGNYKPDGKPTTWKVRIVPVSDGYLICRR